MLAFVISFVVIAGFWRGNHRLIGSFNALDGPTLRICIYLVGLVVFIPFTTKAISSPNPANLRCRPRCTRPTSPPWCW